MRIASICSSGGSAFIEVANACPHIEFLVITDRECDIEDKCRAKGIRYHRAVDKTNDGFSEQAAETLERNGPFDFVIMFFSRLVTGSLLSDFELLNIHPALLPAFRGIGGVRMARQHNVKYFGATLHVANAEMDRGPIIAQACQAIGPRDQLPYLEKLSFIHKVCLFLLAVDLYETKNLRMENGLPVLNDDLSYTDRLNPMLINQRYIDYVYSLQRREGVAFLQ